MCVILPHVLVVCSRSCLTSSGRERDLKEPALLETVTLVPPAPELMVGMVIDQRHQPALPNLPPRSCHPASDAGRLHLHPTTATEPAPEGSIVYLTVPPRPGKKLTLESGMLSAKNTTKVLIILPAILVVDGKSSGTTPSYAATRIHSYPGVGWSSTM